MIVSSLNPYRSSNATLFEAILFRKGNSSFISGKDLLVKFPVFYL